MADTIKQKILFQMGTTGTGKATKSFASMATKIVAVGAALTVAVKGMNKLYNSAVELDRQLRALNTDMSIYNQETKGLIGTNDGLSAAIQLQNAGIKASAEEMSALGKAAIQMNQQLGGGPDGATTQFNSLVKSIVNARETGLVKFGVELSQTADKTAASQEALEKLTNKFGDVSVEAETVKEKMFAFNNSLGTVAAAQFNGMLFNMNEAMMDVVGSTGMGTDAMVQFEQDIMDTNGTITEYTGSLAGMHRAGAAWIAQLFNDRQAMINLNNEYQEHLDVLKNIEWRKSRIAGYKAESASLQESTDDFKSVMDTENTPWRDRQRAGRRLQTSIKGKSTDDLTATDREFIAQGGMGIDYSDVKVKTPSSGGRRGRARQQAPQERIDFKSAISDDITAMPRLSSTADDFGLGAGMGGTDSMFSGGVGDLGLDQVANQRLELNQNMYHSLLGMERQYLAESNRMNAMSNAQKAESTTAMASTVGSTFTNMSKAFNEESKSGFNAMKAMAYAGNIVETTLASTAAFRSVMQSTPFPFNVVAAPAYAATVAAMGAKAGNKIRKQKFGTSGSVSSATGKTSFPSGGLGSGSSQQSNNYVFNVNVDGNTIHKSMIDANDMANQSGEKHFATGTN